MYVRYVQCGVGHDIQNPASSCRQCANPTEDDIVEDQSLYDGTEVSSSDLPEVGEPEEWGTIATDVGCEEDSVIDEDIRESSDSSIDEDDEDDEEADSSDVYYFSF